MEAAYRKRLQALVKLMNRSVMHYLRAAYKRNEPEVAQDALPATELKRAVRKLQRRWQKNFDTAAPRLAKYFSTAAEKRSKRVLQQALRDGGFSVKFKMSRAMQDVMRATINEQVSLIKSIPQKYFTDLEGDVMRSVTAGRDLEQLTKVLQKNYGVTKKRAAFIARDQNNKMSSSFVRVRQQEAGITKAIWMHSHGGKHPRPSHLANNGKEYDVDKGWFDPDAQEWIYPGILPNCRCVSRSIVPGFE